MYIFLESSYLFSNGLYLVIAKDKNPLGTI